MVSPYSQPEVFFRPLHTAVRCLILDYDGTLVPLAARPELAPPDDALLTLLGGLAARARIHVVSGRSREDLQRWLGHLPIGLHAEHGFWSRLTAASAWTALELDHAAWKEALRPSLLRFVEHTAGAFLEEKTSALCLHYRGADLAIVADTLPALRASLSDLLEAHDLELLAGAKVLELRSRRASSGSMAERGPGQLGIEAWTRCASWLRAMGWIAALVRPCL